MNIDFNHREYMIHQGTYIVTIIRTIPSKNVSVDLVNQMKACDSLIEWLTRNLKVK